MIFGNINDLTQYNLLSKNENMKIALDYIKANNFMKEINTKPFENYFEVHHKYADIFYVIKGQEDVYFTSSKELNTLEDYIEKDDIVHGNVNTYQKISLKKGDYIIVFPEDAHAPGRGNGETLEKLVVKVKVSN